MVICIVAWPINSWMALSGAPLIAKWLANVCRNTCQPMRRKPARLQARQSGHLHSAFVNQFPPSSQNTSSPRKCRCDCNVLIAMSPSGISRGLPFLGGPNFPRTKARRTTMRPAFKSTSSQRSASNSLCRIPVFRPTAIMARHSPSAAVVRRSASG